MAIFAGGVGVATGAVVAGADALDVTEVPGPGVDPSPTVWAFCFLLQAARARAKSTGTATDVSRIQRETRL